MAGCATQYSVPSGKGAIVGSIHIVQNTQCKSAPFLIETYGYKVAPGLIRDIEILYRPEKHLGGYNRVTVDDIFKPEESTEKRQYFFHSLNPGTYLLYDLEATTENPTHTWRTGFEHINGDNLNYRFTVHEGQISYVGSLQLRIYDGCESATMEIVDESSADLSNLTPSISTNPEHPITVELAEQTDV